VAVALAVAAAVVALPVDNSVREDVSFIQSYSSGGGVNGASASEAAAAQAEETAEEKAKEAKVGKVAELIPTPPPPTAEHMAKVRNYIKKIKEYQTAKNQKWDPMVEEDLADKLALVDSFDVPTKEELDIEAQLRQGSKPQYRIEMSLRKYSRQAEDRKKQKEAEKAKGIQEQQEKQDRKQALEKENAEATKQIAKYRKLSVSKKLQSQTEEARMAVLSATKLEAKAKKTKHFRSFAKEYSLDKSAEKNADYPKEELGEAKKDHIIMGHIEKVTDDHEFDTNPETANLSADERLDQKLSNDALKLLAKDKSP